MGDGAVSRLVGEMRRLRAAVGNPTLQDLESHAYRQRLGTLPPQTLSPILRGERVPRWETLELFVRACRAAGEVNGGAIEQSMFDLARWAELAEEPAAATASGARRNVPDQQAAQYVNCNVIEGDHAVMNVIVSYGD